VIHAKGAPDVRLATHRNEAPRSALPH
jgi:hypothetical protein